MNRLSARLCAMIVSKQWGLLMHNPLTLAAFLALSPTNLREYLRQSDQEARDREEAEIVQADLGRCGSKQNYEWGE